MKKLRLLLFSMLLLISGRSAAQFQTFPGYDNMCYSVGGVASTHIYMRGYKIYWDVDDDSYSYAPGDDQYTIYLNSVQRLLLSDDGEATHIVDLDAATGNETAFTLDYTVNKATSGNDTGLYIKKTDTASPGTSLAFHIEVASSTVFSVEDDGTITGANADVIDNSAAGAWTFTGSGGATNKEDATFDFETVANTVGVSSSTGVAAWDFGTINLAASAVSWSGDVTLEAGGSIVTTTNGNIVFMPHGTGHAFVQESELYIVDATTPTWDHAPVLGVEGVGEFDAQTYFDTGISAAVAHVEGAFTCDGASQFSSTLGVTGSLTASSGASMGDADITNVGNMACDSLSPDGTNINIDMATGLLSVKASTALTNTNALVQRLYHETSGTAAAGFGVGIDASLESGSGNQAIVGAQYWALTDATDSAEESKWCVQTADIGDDGLADRLCVDKDGNVVAGGTVSMSGITLLNGETITNAVDGQVAFTGVGGSNNESIYFDLETVADEISIGTATGVTVVNFGAIDITADDISIDGDITGTSATTIHTTTNGNLNLEPDGSGIVAINNSNIMLADTGTSVNSPSIVFNADAAGTELEGSLFLVQGANPYLRFSVDDDSATPSLTAFLDMSDNAITFPADNTVDIGAAGATRPKNIYAAGFLTIGAGVNFANAEKITNAVDGKIAITGVGGSNNEDIVFDMESTANQILISSTTGANAVEFTAMDVDINGNELYLDADRDTYLLMDTDDTIQFYTGGARRLYVNNNWLEIDANKPIRLNGGYFTDAAAVTELGDNCTTAHANGSGDICVDHESEFHSTVHMDSLVRIGNPAAADANYVLHVSTATAGGGIRVESTHADAAGVNITMHHNSASPADGDVATCLQLNGEDASGNDTTYANICMEIQDTNASAEEGIVRHKVVQDSALTEYLRLDATNAITSVIVSKPLQLQVIEGTTPAVPITCATGREGTMVYVDDTDDSGAGAVCICIATADDGAGAKTAWDWVRMDDHTAACPFF